MTIAIDLFAGAGGFSTGAALAGLSVAWAANHWPRAVEFHAANHPTTTHACQDLQQADWTRVPDHDILLASPACQGHSRARGVERPHHDAQRSTAWAVIAAAEVKRPRRLVVENVPEFVQWTLYPIWRQALETLGYSVTASVIDAADVGVPQHRRRGFVVASLDGPVEVRPPREPHVAFRTILDTRAGGWSPVATKAAATQRRAAQGRLDHGDEFLIAYYGNEHGGRSLDRPLGTVTTRDRYALVRGDVMRMLTVDEYRAAMGFPADYVLPRKRVDATKMLGNAVCPPVAAYVLREVAR